MDELKNWTKVTRGLYRYVLAPTCCYEIHVHYWENGTDILTARASVFIVGNWHTRAGKSFFERECILADQSISECLEAAVKDNGDNNNC